MLGYDIRGDASRGDFDAVSEGTLSRTFGASPTVAAVKKAVASAAAAVPGGNLTIGLVFFAVLIAYAYRRVL